MMTLQLSDEQAAELRSLLDGALRDLSHEIAATDNADFRTGLRHSREVLKGVRHGLGELVVTGG